MSDYPNSPYSRARHALELFNQGSLTEDAFVAQLAALSGSVDTWRSQLDAIRSDDYAEGLALIEDAKESLQAVSEGVEMLRDYAEDRDPKTAAEALELMAEASEFLAQLLDITEQNMEDLEDER